MKQSEYLHSVRSRSIRIQYVTAAVHGVIANDTVLAVHSIPDDVTAIRLLNDPAGCIRPDKPELHSEGFIILDNIVEQVIHSHYVDPDDVASLGQCVSHDPDVLFVANRLSRQFAGVPYIAPSRTNFLADIIGQ